MPPSDLDLTDPAFVTDPYPALAELRAQGPMVWHEPSERWLATTHAAVTAVLRDRRLGRLWHDHEPVDVMEPFNVLHRHQLMESEGAQHRRMRGMVAQAFSRGHVQRLTPAIETLADEMVGRLEGRVDVLADYAEPMPVFVIADLLGVPRADHLLLRDWSQAIVAMYEPAVDAVTREAAVEASAAFAAYVRDVMALRRGAPGADLVSDLSAASDGGAGLSDDELVATIVLLLNAGHEASVNAFGNALVALLAAPEQLERITSGSVPLEGALEELLRYDTPLQLFERTVTEDCDIAGTTVRSGQKVACLMGSANRDEAVFERPDVLDVGRDPGPHLTFGLGPHFCLGAPLARLELRLSLGTLLVRYPCPVLIDEPPRRPAWVLRGYRSIPVQLEAS